MAKKMRRILAMLLVLMMTVSTIATPALATEATEPAAVESPAEPPAATEDPAEVPAETEAPAEEKKAVEETKSKEPSKMAKAAGGWGWGSDQYEWYQVYVQGNLVASGQGSGGDMYWLGTHYTASITYSGSVVNWTIQTHGGKGNKFTGVVDLNKFITVPEGYTVKDYEIAKDVSGVNSAQGSAYFDNAIIRITIKTIYNEDTGDEIEIPSEPTPTDPEPTDPPLVETKVTVNHIYNVFDVYTGKTTEEGRTASTADVTEGDEYTAAAVPSYQGEAYEQTGVSPAMTITAKAEASENVITITYTRQTDSTPIPVETKVTVNHIYNVFDVYTGETSVEGRTSATYDVTEGDRYTAEPVAAYGGNTYVRQTGDDALSITIAADAAENVINISYQRTIDTTPVNYTPVVRVEKTADKEVYEHGETITWTITVKNVSEHTAYNVAVVDELTGDTWTIAELAPGAEQGFTATTENAAPGSIKNVVAVSWDDNDEIPDGEEPNEIKKTGDEIVVSVNDPIPENYTPVVSVVKTADKAVCKEGESITFTIVVKNISEYPAYDVVVVDELAKGYWTIAELAPGAEQVFDVTMDNVAAGSVKNTVVVSWNDGDEIPDEEEDEVTEIADEEIVIVEERINYTPVLSVTKKAGKRVYKVGQNINWTITVKNIGEHAAYNVVVVDDMTGDRWVIAALAAGAEETVTVTTRAAKTGYVTNAVVVSWEDGDEIDDANEPEEPKSGSSEDTVKVEKKTNPVETQPTEPTPTEQIPTEPAAQADEIEIIDEDVPLASAPKTGDISNLWIALSGISAAGVILLGRKREEDED